MKACIDCRQPEEAKKKKKSCSDWHQGGNRALNFGKSINFRLIFAPKISLIVKVSWAFHITNRHPSGLDSPGSCCLDILPTYLQQGDRTICISHFFDAWDTESTIRKILIHLIWNKWKKKLFKSDCKEVIFRCWHYLFLKTYILKSFPASRSHLHALALAPSWHRSNLLASF